MSEGIAEAAHAAGVAEATAEHAIEDATEAVEAAEAAQSTADVAVQIADGASGAAWDAQMAVGELREEMTAGLAALGARIDELAEGLAQPAGTAPAGAGDDEGATRAPARKAEKKSPDGGDGTKDTGGKKKRGGWWDR